MKYVYFMHESEGLLRYIIANKKDVRGSFVSEAYTGFQFQVNYWLDIKGRTDGEWLGEFDSLDNPIEVLYG